jgi:PIN domain nuclease of toxin-antitoxin system
MRPQGLLLDTHVWLWLALGVTEKISPDARERLEAAGHSGGLLVSVVSVWELALLVARDCVTLPLPVRDWVALAFRRPEIRLIGLHRASTVIDSVFLPGEMHGDPADRFLIATARRRRVPLATHDRRIIEYGRAGHLNVLEI